MVQALHVLSETSSQLVVVQDSAFKGQALFWLLFPWIICFLGIWFSWHRNKSKLGTTGLIVTIIISAFFCLIFDFAGGAKFFIKHTLVLSRDTSQAASEESWFGKLTDRTVYDINAIQYAQLEFARSGTRRIVLVMKDDSVVAPLSSVYTDEQGQYAVVNAINRFLDVPANPTHPVHQGS